MRKPMDIDFERCTSGIEFESTLKGRIHHA